MLSIQYSTNLALRPRNPLLFKSPERTAAVRTTIFFLNSLVEFYGTKEKKASLIL